MPKTPKTIEVRNIPEAPDAQFHADIVPGKSIRIFGVRWPRAEGHSKGEFDRTFKIGDVVEQHSYNLIYTGPITKIGAKTVTVQDGVIPTEVRRLTLAQFIRRNWDLDLERIAKANAETSRCI